MCGTFEFFCKQQQEVESLESRYEEVDDIAKSQCKSRLGSNNMLAKQTTAKADTGKANTKYLICHFMGYSNYLPTRKLLIIR